MKFTKAAFYLPVVFAAMLLAITSSIAQDYHPPMAEQVLMHFPETEFVYEAIVDIEPGIDLGTGPLGQRAMVPITGGTFEGPNIRGTVLAGGADRQLVRNDGVRELDALYEMQTDDGAIITVRNRVLSVPGQENRLSYLQITAPEEYDWLNKSVHVGTLNSLRPERNSVLIRVFRIK
tara:strand:- start:861 stop:1391 length:531 start_codon:yes stop_codon:yes gene_type:complete